MKALFLVPPLTDPTRLPEPLLRAAAMVLATGGDIFDANRAAYRTFITNNHLMARQRILKSRLPGDGHGLISTAEEFYDYYRLLKSRLHTDDGAWNDPDAILQDLADPRLNFAKRDALRQDVERALDAAIAPYRANIRLNDLTAIHTTESSAELAAAAQLGEENPFCGFWNACLSDEPRMRMPLWLVWLDRDQQLIPLATLLAIVAGRSAPQIRLVGPFTENLSLCATTWLTACVAGAHRTMDEAFDAVGIDGPPTDAGAIADALRILAPGRASEQVTLELDPNECGRLETLTHACSSSLRLHVDKPLSIEALQSLAARIPVPRKWSASLRFGEVPNAETLVALSSRGMHSLHFEVKGFAGYVDEEAARVGIERAFAHTREAGMTVLASLVYGFPHDSPEAFERFLSFLSGRLDAVDRLVRFRLFQVHSGSPQERLPGEHGIVEVVAPDPNHDLARTRGYITRSGFDSRLFGAQAARAIAALAAPSPHFPATPLAMDSSDFGDAGLEHPIPSRTRSMLPVPGRADVVRLDPDVVLVSANYAFRALDAQFRGWLPRPGLPLPLPLAELQSLSLLRNRRTGAVTGIGESGRRLLEALREQCTVDELARETATDPAVLCVALGRLLAADLIQTMPSSAASPQIEDAPTTKDLAQ
ncbi:hypothetical protein B5P46_01650 [Rhizobium leguminosarum]|uniref:Uncharacterized protein n=1 Tax=Rhizobium leguminosarum TaxID=384 RepID=A0A4Q1UCU5_RHILE|nr:hypothetical protein [Rhizobium leguminosarum]RXT29804.1 hypothetical protein B5P46_01650 [Rhizobium leguminosarum]